MHRRRHSLALALPMLVLGAFACTDAALDPGPANADAGPGNMPAPPSASGPTSTASPTVTDRVVPGAPDASDDAAIADAAVEAEAAAPLAYRHYDINQVLVAGASDATANGGAPYLTTTQPFHNVKLDVGIFTGASCDGEGCTVYRSPSSFVDLVEGDVYLPSVGRTETQASGFANQAAAFATSWLAKVGLPARGHDILVTNHGRSGAAYDCLRKGACDEYKPGGSKAKYLRPFDDDGMRQVTDAKRIATDLGKTHVVRAVNVVHGQTDSDDNEYVLSHYDYRTDGSGQLVGNYTNALVEWQHDYEASVRAITGQTEAVPLFVSQFGSFTEYAHSVIPQRQLDAHVQAPGKVLVVTPNYPFRQDGDCNHYVPQEQRRLGAYFAKAYQRVVVEGGTWEPTRPRTITRVGNVITVELIVPVPPLVIDKDRVVDPGNLGFTFKDDTSSATITNVAVANDTVTISLSKAPTGANKRLGYASWNEGADRCPGPTKGARGNLRDSDPTQGYYRDGANAPYELFNWLVQFDLPVE